MPRLALHLPLLPLSPSFRNISTRPNFYRAFTSATMAPIERITLFKIPNEADQDRLLEQYKILAKTATKVRVLLLLACCPQKTRIVQLSLGSIHCRFTCTLIVRLDIRSLRIDPDNISYPRKCKLTLNFQSRTESLTSSPPLSASPFPIPATAASTSPLRLHLPRWRT